MVAGQLNDSKSKSDGQETGGEIEMMLLATHLRKMLLSNWLQAEEANSSSWRRRPHKLAKLTATHPLSGTTDVIR